MRSNRIFTRRPRASFSSAVLDRRGGARADRARPRRQAGGVGAGYVGDGGENSSRPRPRRPGRRSAGSGAACARAPAVPAFRSSTICPASSVGQRSDVLAVDRGHRRDVARAQALERAHVDVLVLGRRGHRLVELVGAAQRARDVRAHEHVVASASARCRTCRRRWPRCQVGGRQLHHRGDLIDRLGRAPAVNSWAACSAGIAAERRSGYLAIAASISAAARPGTGVVAGSGIVAGGLVRSTASSQPGTREPWPKRGTLLRVGRVALRLAAALDQVAGVIAADAHRSMPPRIGSSIASVAIRSAM